LIKTHFYKPQEFHGDTIVSENIIQDLPPDWIISFLEVY
jgi:hypothetical protein